MRSSFCFVLVVCLSASSAIATTYVVAPDGSGDFPTIQVAIDAVVDGDIIELTDGTFVGDGNRDIDFLGKAVTVGSQSGDPDSCIIDCENSGRGFRFESGETLTSILTGVTITHGYQAIWVHSASPTIINCHISDNRVGGGGGGGVRCVGSSTATFIDCEISDMIRRRISIG